MADAEDVARESPRTAGFLAGHDAAEATLLAALASGRCAHAWLLTGPRGVGKATFAYRVARFLLSDRTSAGPDLFGAAPETMDVGADDPVIGRIAGRAHPNLLVLEVTPDPNTGRKRTEIVVDDARRATRFLHSTAADGGWRIVLVDAVDDLNRNAANALLKIIEEPPDKCLFLLVNHARGNVLQTLRSRCRALTMPPLSDADSARVIETLRPEISPDERAELIGLSSGSPGRALALMDAGGLALRRELAAVLDQEGASRTGASRTGASQSGASQSGASGIGPCLRFAERFARADAAGQFRVTGELIGEWLAERCREEAGAGAASAKRWTALWQRTAERFSLADARNLDRQQVMLDTLFAIRGGA